MSIESSFLHTVETKRLFFEAMKHGYVEALHNVLLLTGGAGYGKHNKCLLLGLPPPRIHQSTPLAEEAVRAISIVQAVVSGSDESLWEIVSFEHCVLRTCVCVMIITLCDCARNLLALEFEFELTCRLNLAEKLLTRLTFVGV